MAKHETHEVTPPALVEEIATAARTLLAATERLGPRVTAHAPGCPAEHGGPCTCGAADFQDALHELGAALKGL